jgi:hypothetical protein
MIWINFHPAAELIYINIGGRCAPTISFRIVEVNAHGGAS